MKIGITWDSGQIQLAYTLLPAYCCKHYPLSTMVNVGVHVGGDSIKLLYKLMGLTLI